MNPKAHVLALVITLGGPMSLVVGCGSGTSIEPASTGGAPAGSPDGGTATGGAPTTGGSSGTGGQQATGGGPAPGSGGAVGTGGGTGGGAATTGGSSGTGGSPGTGGAAPDAGIAGTGGNRDAGTGDTIVVPPPSGKITVWLAGDSTMQPCSTTCPCGWGSQFQPLFNSNVTVINSGAGGRSIQTWLYDPNVTITMANGECVVNPKTYSTRWQAMLNGMKPGDYLFIEFGINDSDSTCNRHVGTALFETYLGVMAQAAKQRGAQAVLMTSTSLLQCTGATVTPNRGFRPATMNAATANNIPMIDLTQLSADLYTRLGLCPSSLDFTSTTSAVGKFFCDDHTHFEAAGAAQIAGVVAKALRDQNIPLASYLK